MFAVNDFTKVRTKNFFKKIKSKRATAKMSKSFKQNQKHRLNTTQFSRLPLTIPSFLLFRRILILKVNSTNTKSNISSIYQIVRSCLSQSLVSTFVASAWRMEIVLVHVRWTRQSRIFWSRHGYSGKNQFYVPTLSFWEHSYSIGQKTKATTFLSAGNNGSIWRIRVSSEGLESRRRILQAKAFNWSYDIKCSRLQNLSQKDHCLDVSTETKTIFKQNCEMMSITKRFKVSKKPMFVLLNILSFLQNQNINFMLMSLSHVVILMRISNVNQMSEIDILLLILLDLVSIARVLTA